MFIAFILQQIRMHEGEDEVRYDHSMVSDDIRRGDGMH